MHGDSVTFGPGILNGNWDQSVTGGKLFAVKTSFDEETYTTELDQNGPGFEEREHKARWIASKVSSVRSVIPAHDVF